MIGLLAMLPGCACPLPWSQPAATQTMNSSTLRQHPVARRDKVLSALSRFPSGGYGLGIQDSAARHQRARKQPRCDRGSAVSLGMTRAEVYASCWGEPTSISGSSIGSNHFELLVYNGYDYVFLEDGIVTSIQASSR
jgi:hypothetical protein